MKSILVLGGSYFLGKTFIKTAVKNPEYDITVFNRGSQPLNLPGVTEIKGDRRDEVDLAKLSQGSYDVIVDFCAYKKGDISSVVASLSGMPQQYIFVSTTDVYSRSVRGEINENSPLEVRNYPGTAGEYITGKVALEWELSILCSKNGFSCTSIRPAFIYGPDNYAPREDIYFNWIQEAGDILQPSDATGEFQFCFVEDVAKAIVLCIEKPAPGKRCFNLCNPERVTYESFTQLLRDVTGSDFGVAQISVDEIKKREIPLPFPLTEDESHFYNGEKICALGLKYTSLLAGMKKTYRIYAVEEHNSKRTEEVLKGLDALFDEDRLDEVEAYLKSADAQAVKDGDAELSLTVLNELIGYYRIMTRYDEAEDTANRILELIDENGLNGEVTEGTSLLNIATVYRAMGKDKVAEALYIKSREILEMNLPSGDYRLAGLYNNMSLLYQNKGEAEKSLECLIMAADVLQNGDKRIQLAITYTNMGLAYEQLHDYEMAKDCLSRSYDIFIAENEDDEHFSGCLNALGNVSYVLADYEKSAEYYEKAQEKSYESYGDTENLRLIQKNLRKSYAALGKNVYTHMMPLCRDYFEAYGRPMIEEKFPEYADRIAAGLVGEGSECFGFDDEISLDHDCGPGFALWVSDEVYNEIGEELSKAYDELPKIFAGYLRRTTDYGNGRCGVCRIDDFYRRVLGGVTVNPLFVFDGVDEFALAAAVNGEVFTDPEGIFTEKRKHLLNYYPEDLWLSKLARALMESAQAGQYNYRRCIERNNMTEAYITLSRFVESVMETVFLINRQYAPYYKWMKRALMELPELSCVAGMLDELIALAHKAGAGVLDNYDEVFQKIEEIAGLIADTIRETGISENPDNYLETQGREIISFLRKYTQMDLESFEDEVKGTDENISGCSPEEDACRYSDDVKQREYDLKDVLKDDIEDDIEASIKEGIKEDIKEDIKENKEDIIENKEDIKENNEDDKENNEDDKENADEFKNDVSSEVTAENVDESDQENVSEDKNPDDEKLSLVDRIVMLEWEAFDKVINEGGRAECQDNFGTFSIMRKSQYLTWNKEMLKQYISDFEAANAAGRNLITEKYARMEESTAPDKWEEIKGYFPVLSDETKDIINVISAIQVNWMHEFAKQYPKLAGNARSIDSSEDTEFNTSYETYLRGELGTYSDKMLSLYGYYIVKIRQQHKNLACLVMEQTVRLYGYDSLDDAEKRLDF